MPIHIHDSRNAQTDDIVAAGERRNLTRMDPFAYFHE